MFDDDVFVKIENDEGGIDSYDGYGQDGQEYDLKNGRFVGHEIGLNEDVQNAENYDQGMSDMENR